MGRIAPDPQGEGAVCRRTCPATLPLEIGFADVGGWDTHVNQGASQAS